MIKIYLKTPIKKYLTSSMPSSRVKCQPLAPNSITNLNNKIATINIADHNPNLPISFAIASNFSWSGVYSASPELKLN